MNTTTATETKTTLIQRIRNLFGELRGGQHAMFRYDREFRA